MKKLTIETVYNEIIEYIKFSYFIFEQKINEEDTFEQLNISLIDIVEITVFFEHKYRINIDDKKINVKISIMEFSKIIFNTILNN